MTEDNIRYYWLATMLQEDSDLNNYTLEYPYGDKLKGKELDLLYQQGKQYFAFEIKFHRSTSNSGFAHTEAAGKLINDILRLQSFNEGQSPQRYLLYITDDEMDQYLNNNSNSYRKELQKFYMGAPMVLFDLDFTQQAHPVPDTFLKQIKDLTNLTNPIIHNLKLLEKYDGCTHSQSFKGRHFHVRLYQV